MDTGAYRNTGRQHKKFSQTHVPACLPVGRYWYRIYDRYGADISALAIFTGGKRQQHPDMFHKTFMGTEITHRYNAYHIFDHSEAELLTMDNPFALIVLATQKALLQGKVPEEALASHRLTVARALIQSKKFSHKKIEKLLLFLKNFIYIGNEEINRKFLLNIYYCLLVKRNSHEIFHTSFVYFMNEKFHVRLMSKQNS